MAESRVFRANVWLVVLGGLAPSDADLDEGAVRAVLDKSLTGIDLAGDLRRRLPDAADGQITVGEVAWGIGDVLLASTQE